MKLVENMSVQENVVYDFLSKLKNSDVTEDLKVYKRKVKQYRRDFLKACNEVIKSMKANHRAWQTKIILGTAYDIATELFRVEDEIRDIWCSSPNFDEVEYQEYQDEVFQYRKKWLRLWTSTWMYIFDRNQRFMKLSNGKQLQQEEHQPEDKKTDIFVLTPDFASQKTRSSVGLLFPVAVVRQGKAKAGKDSSQQQQQRKAEQDPKAKNRQKKIRSAEQQQKVQQERKTSQEQKPQKEPKTHRDQKVEQEPQDQKDQQEQNIQQDEPAQPDQKDDPSQKVLKSNAHLKVKIVGGKVVRVKITRARLQDLQKCELPEGGMELQITDIGSLETGVISGFKYADPHAKFVYDVLPEKMAEFCQTDVGKRPFTPEDNQLCIVQLPHGQHLRAIMLQKVAGPGGLAHVKYIDYGLSARVPFTSIRRIPRQFVKGIPAVAADLTIKNFPKTVTSQMIINATTHMQVPDEDRLRLVITNNEKSSPGSYTIEAPELLKAMMQ